MNPWTAWAMFWATVSMGATQTLLNLADQLESEE
jgi:hypothetical protein